MKDRKEGRSKASRGSDSGSGSDGACVHACLISNSNKTMNSKRWMDGWEYGESLFFSFSLSLLHACTAGLVLAFFVRSFTYSISQKKPTYIREFLFAFFSFLFSFFFLTEFKIKNMHC